MAIIGDKSDRISGIYGWGPKKVKQLFEAVPEKATFEEALLAIEKQIPEKFLNDFYSDLDLTLLHNDVPNIPPAAPLQMAPPDAVTELKLPDFIRAYRQVWQMYEADPVIA